MSVTWLFSWLRGARELHLELVMGEVDLRTIDEDLERRPLAVEANRVVRVGGRGPGGGGDEERGRGSEQDEGPFHHGDLSKPSAGEPS